MADASINIELKGISQIRAELKALKGELANATDPTQMAELAAKAGLLSDKLKDANEKVAVFAAGSPFEQTNNALGLMGSQLASLDFEGASESAKSFAVAAKGINGEQIANQLKGLGGVVTNLGKGFLSLGATLLTNPIFLIAGVVTAIIVAIGALLNKFGLLKPIINAVSSAFKFLMDVINGVVDSIKDFLDWLGLTSFAAEEAAERQQKALEKIAEAREGELKKYIKGHDRKIELAKIEGKNTVELEREKQRAIAATESARYKELVAALEAAKKKGDVDEKELKDLKEKALQAKENASNARFEIQKINLQETVDRKKALEERERIESEAARKAAERRREENEKRKKEQEELNKWFLETNKKLLEDFYANFNPTVVDTSILPPPEVLEEQAESLVPVVAETFSNMDNLRLAFRENFSKSFEGTLGAADSLFKGMGALAEAFAGDSEASAKKAFDIQKASNIAQAVMDTYKGAVGAFTQAVSTYPAPLGQIIGAIQAGATVAMGVANIKKISSQKFGDKSGNVSKTGMGGGTATANPVTPSVNLFGQNNNANNVSSSSPVESNQNIVVKAVVSETEITNTQNKIKNIQQASAL